MQKLKHHVTLPIHAHARAHTHAHTRNGYGLVYKLK